SDNERVYRIAKRVAANYEFLSLIDPIPEPSTALFAWLVVGVLALRDNTLEPEFSCNANQIRCTRLQSLGQSDRRRFAFLEIFSYGCAPNFKRLFQESAALIDQNVEGVKEDRLRF